MRPNDSRACLRGPHATPHTRRASNVRARRHGWALPRTKRGSSGWLQRSRCAARAVAEVQSAVVVGADSSPTEARRVYRRRASQVAKIALRTMS